MPALARHAATRLHAAAWRRSRLSVRVADVGAGGQAETVRARTRTRAGPEGATSGLPAQAWTTAAQIRRGLRARTSLRRRAGAVLDPRTLFRRRP